MKEVQSTLRNVSAEVLIVDGELNHRLVNDAARNGIKTIVGVESERLRIPENVRIFTLKQLEEATNTVL